MNELKVTDVQGQLHQASCIISYVSENALNNDEVGLGETLKAAEELVLSAIRALRGEEA